MRRDVRKFIGRTRSKIEKLSDSMEKTEKSIGLIAELVTDPSFKVNIVNSLFHKLKPNGELFVSRAFFNNLINDLILLLDRIELCSESNADSQLKSLVLEIQGILSRNDVKEISVDRFDPCYCRVIKVIEGSEKEVVLSEIIRKGYICGNKVLRPADVVVKAAVGFTKKEETINEEDR